jgi:protein phosphatase
MEAMEIVALSDTGRVRRNNEDAVAFDAAASVAVLADGMGGLDGGEVASRVAVETVLEALTGVDQPDEALLKAAVEMANDAVCRAARQASIQMGTTVVAWLSVTPGQCLVAHVGDSRVYRIRDSGLKPLTSDHSMVQQLVDDGLLSEVEARTSRHRNVITRALGLEDKVSVDVRSWVYAPGDLFLLCSDGLTDMLSEAEIATVLARSLTELEGGLTDTAAALVASAYEAGGHDNISVLLVRPG